MKNLYPIFLTKIKLKSTVLLTVMLLLSFITVEAQVRVPFTQRTSVYSPGKTIYNIKGDFTMIGNTNLTLVNYGDGNSNDANMRYVDIDNDANTLNSSSANLTLSTENGANPDCSNIVYAGLYWTGRASNSSDSPNIFTVLQDNSTSTISHGNSITNTNYSMSVSRLGSNNNYYLMYTFTGSSGQPTVEFEFLNSSTYIRYRINGGSWQTPSNQSSSTSSNTRTVTFDPVIIYQGSNILTVDRLVRDSRTGRTLDQYRNSATARVGVADGIKTFDKRKVSIKGPSSANYTQVTANADDIYYPVTSDGFMYSAYAEVTDYVRTNGLGAYTVADVALVEGNGGGTGYYGGWGMIVIYENDKMKWRDVTIFDGHSYVAGSITADFEIPVSGFNTVQSGPVNMKLGMMAGEGDRNISGDYFQIRNHQDNNWVTLSHGGNNTNNFFNSSIYTGGNTRNPELLNNTGLDISMFDIPNNNNSVITNNQTATRFRYGTTQDTFVIFNITMSVDAYIPEVENTLTVQNVHGSPVPVGGPYNAQPGQEVEFSVDVKNLGTEAVNDYKIVIPIPFTSTFVPGSLSSNIFFTPNPVPNNLYFDPSLGATGSIVWDFGTLPLPADAQTLLASMTFKLRATDNCAILSNPNCANNIHVNGNASGTGSITGISFKDRPFILGYNTEGNCQGEPIYQPITVGIIAGNYVIENCVGVPLVQNFHYCNGETSVSAAQLASAFPPGTTFYATYPVDENTPEITVFPIELGNSVTYYAVPFNAEGCYFEFTVSACSPIIAENDSYNIECSSSNTIGNILINDSINNQNATPQNVSITVLSGSYPYISIDSNGNVNVIAGITTGTYTFEYRICDIINTTNCDTATVTVTILDDTAPIWTSTLPNNITVECSDVPEPAQLTASDVCGEVTITYTESITPGDCDGNYEIIRTWTAIDNSNNQITHIQTIIVQDTTAPVFVGDLPTNVTVECGDIPLVAKITATDNCGVVTENFNETTEQGDCEGSYRIIRTWTAVDACGNEISHTQTITVQDTTAPEFVGDLPANLSVECGTVPAAAALTATDNCGNATVNFNETTEQGDCEGSYSIIRTWTATDACGNEASHVQTIIVQDTTAPVFVEELPANVSVECGTIPAAATLTATDNCGDATVNFNETTEQGDCEGSYTITRTWTATDACGNEISHTQTITVQDTTAPVFVGDLPANVSVECGTVPVADTLTATDNCGNATVNFNETTEQGDCEGSYTITRTWTATDACGNEASHVQTIIV
ncbi:MAG: hypothetical protein RBR78_08580, partial [Flavobacteriaceae bacterium]|nr:hypothetical protein [Flavobacteriaceae bacterium]